MSELPDPTTGLERGPYTLELGPDGVNEYVDVTKSTKYLQSCLDDHLDAIGAPHETDYYAAIETTLALQDGIEKDFESLSNIDYNASLVAQGEGVVMFVDSEGMCDLALIHGSIHLHGKLKKPVVMPAPILEAVAVNGDFLPNTVEAVQQMAVLFELTDPLLFNVATMELEMEIPDESQVYLPLIYTGLKIKRRVDE